MSASDKFPFRSMLLAVSLLGLLSAPLAFSASGEGVDSDGDGVYDQYDNCAYDYNPEQLDSDSDGQGDACDACDDSDKDEDGIVNCYDSCPYEAETFNGYEDGDGCPDEAPQQEADYDQDGISDNQDNCMYSYNPYQEDADSDGQGDACDSCDDRDSDYDGVANCVDYCPDEYGSNSNNGCPETQQPAQEDYDKDGIIDTQDNCPYAYNSDQYDSDMDGTGDACESYDCSQSDADSDKVNDCVDMCPKEPETLNGYEDSDGCPDAAPSAGTTIPPANFIDSDMDKISDQNDNCPTVYNPTQADSDMDLIGDACEKDGATDAQILSRITPNVLISAIPVFNYTDPLRSLLIVRPSGGATPGAGLTFLFVDNIHRSTCAGGIACSAVIPELTIRSVIGAATTIPNGQISIIGTVSDRAIVEALRSNTSCVATAGQNDSDNDGVRDSCDRCDLARTCEGIGRQGSTDIACNGQRARMGTGQSYLSALYDTVSSRNGCGCEDTDGINYFVSGRTFSETVSGGISAGDAFGSGAGCVARSSCLPADEDYCIDDRTLSESYCSAEGPAHQEVTCPGGCQDGRCACDDSDGGPNYYTRGSLLGINDTCAADNRTLTEYTCGIVNGALSAVPANFTCPYGCSEGACQCADSDGGQNRDVPGRIGLGFGATDLCINYGTGTSQIVREYYSRMQGNACIANFTDFDCEGACVNGSCRAPTCYDYIMNQGETDVDCGGPCAACQYMMVTGRITYEDGYSNGDIATRTTTFTRMMFAPVRSATVRLMPGAGTTEVRGGPVRTTSTDSQGRFTFIIPRWPNGTFFLRTSADNYAAQVNYDYDGCNKYVRFYTDTITLPATGNLDMGELPVYRSTDGRWHVYWTEEATVGCGSRYGSLTGGAAYFNLADDALIARDFIEANRGDTDTMDKVDMAYPKTASDSGAAMTSFSSGEISIPGPNSFYSYADPGYREKTVFHEFGHFTQAEISMYDTNFGDPDHVFCTQKDEEFAMSEGWAEFLAQYLLNRDRNGTIRYINMDGENGAGIETPNCSGGLNEYIEGAVMAVLWDLADAPNASYPAAGNESFDTISGHQGTIVAILDTEMDNLVDAPDMCELVNGGGDGWRDRTGLGSIDNILSRYGMGGVVDDSGC